MVEDKLSAVKEVLIYLRKSRAVIGKTEEESLEVHRDTLVKYAEERKWKYEIYWEIGSSDSIADRDELPRMLDDVKRGKGDAVLVMDLDRLSRNEYDSALIKKIFKDNGILIITPNQIIDLHDEQDNIVAGFYSLIASAEYQMTKKRLQRGRMAAAAKGTWITGTPPYGYRVDSDTKKLAPYIPTEKDPTDRAQVLRNIFEWTVAGMRYKDICIRLNSSGVPTQKRGQWTETTIRKIIGNPVYLGTIRYNRLKGRNTTEGTIRDPSEWLIVENAHEPLVTKEIWDAAQAEIESRQFLAPKARASTHSLSGLLKCPQCGRTVPIQVPKTMRQKRVVGCVVRDLHGRKCQNSGFPYNMVEELIIRQIGEYRDDLIQKIRTFRLDHSEYTLSQEEQIKALQSQVTKAEKALERIEIAWEEEAYTVQEYKERKRARLAEIEDLKREISVLATRTGAAKLDKLERVLETLETILTKHSKLTQSELNRLFIEVIEKIEWHHFETPLRLEIFWKD